MYFNHFLRIYLSIGFHGTKGGKPINKLIYHLNYELTMNPASNEVSCWVSALLALLSSKLNPPYITAVPAGQLCLLRVASPCMKRILSFICEEMSGRISEMTGSATISESSFDGARCDSFAESGLGHTGRLKCITIGVSCASVASAETAAASGALLEPLTLARHAQPFSSHQ